MKCFLNLLFGNFQPTQKKEKHNLKKKNHFLKSQFLLSLFTKKIIYQNNHLNFYFYFSKTPKSTEKSQRGGRPTAASYPKSLLEATKIERPLDKRESGSTCEHASESGLQ